MEMLPGDLRLTFAQELVASKRPEMKGLMSDPVLATLLLAKL